MLATSILSLYRGLVMPERLTVTIPDKNNFYSLYADGLLLRKTYIRETEATIIEYDHNAVVALYYTYPTYREACVVRNASLSHSLVLPGLSKSVVVLFSVHASQVDKLKRSIGFIHSNYGNAFSRDDGFYIRLSFIIRQRGKIDYIALRHLCEKKTS